jgi:hypothetical protein
MAIAGRVAIVPKDVYDASLPYKRLDAVMHNNTLYIAKKNVPAGKTPGADTKDYWMSGPSAGASAPATTTSNGLMSATDKKAIEVLKKPLATCATGRAAAAKVATLANFVLQVGTSIAVKFTDTAGTANPTTGNLTLNVNGTGAKTIGYVRNGNKAAISYASGNFFYNNATHIFTYDGTFWLCMDWNADNNTTYSNFVKSGAGAKAGLVPAPSTTAGTSKYLREDGTWQTPPDTKTSVVNNQTTTVAGYALDARQANPNIDGSLAKQISDLNGSLNKADENALGNWMVGYSVLGAGFVIPIPLINNISLSNKKVKIFTTSGWQECTSQPDSVSKFGSGYNVIYNKGLPENLEIGKAFLCQFISRS